MFSNKRAVSPLIATVLLVMIVISIGAAVMVVIQGINEEQMANIDKNNQLIKCSSDVSLQILSVGNAYRVCYYNDTTQTFAVVMENKGTIDISDWRFTAVGDNITDINGGYDELTKATLGSFRFNFTVSGPLSLIRLSPKIAGGASNPSVTCSMPSLEWDSEEISDLTDCSAVSWDDSIADPQA